MEATSTPTAPAETTPDPKKNLCVKTRPQDNPYEIWRSRDGQFEWKVLKKYQSPAAEAKNPYARWHCATKGPGTFGSYDLGDVYISEIKRYGVRVDEVPASA